MVNAPAPPYVPAKYKGGPQRVDRIVLHSTVSDLYVGAALAIARYFQNPTYVSSAHYTVDNGPRLIGSMGDSACYQCVWDETEAWHDGTNYNSIGVEMCERPKRVPGRWLGRKHKKLLANTAALVRQLCLFYDVPMVRLSVADIRAGKRGICSHADMSKAYPANSSHWDPGRFPWKKFMAQVKGDKMIVTKRGAKKIVNELLAADVFDTPWDSKKNPTWNFKNAFESIWYGSHYIGGDVVPAGASDDNARWYGRNALGEAVKQGRRLQAQVAGLNAAVSALSADSGLTPERVEQIVRDAVKQNIEITGTVEVSGEEQS